MSDHVDEIQLDEAAVKAIADKVAESMAPGVSEAAAKAATEAIEAADKAARKEIKTDEDEEAAAAKSTSRSGLKKGFDSMPKELRFIKQVRAMQNHDYATLREINKIHAELAQKADYGNTGTDADGGYLVPDPDFEAAVERLEEQYGVATRFADNRTINSNSVKLNKKSGSGVSMAEVSEAGAIGGTKFSIAQVTADLRKFAAIAPITDELSEDAAIDFWSEVTQDFARERARIADTLVFTDATSGILETSGIHTVGVGSGDIADITWEDLLDAEVKVPTPSQQNGQWYMHRSVWNVLTKLRAGGSTTGDGQFLFSPSRDLTTPWGVPVVLTEVLPSTTVGGGANAGYAVFGDLKNTKVYTKRGLTFKVLDQAVVKDEGSNDFNLATQDGQALRAITRLLAVQKFAEAYCVVGTGTVS